MRNMKKFLLTTVMLAAFSLPTHAEWGSIPDPNELWLAQLPGSTQSTTHRFEDYPISTVYRGKVRFPDFRGRDKDSSMFRTRIIEGMRDGPNFAGKYSVIQIGCGTGCRFYPVADLTNGRVIGFPLGGEDYGHLDLFYKLDSSLIIAVWDDTPETCSQEAFKIKNGTLTSLGRSSIGRKEGECIGHLNNPSN
jgi:hypothetical protein